jgi:hypothetical protein
MMQLALSVSIILVVSALLNARSSLAQSPRDWSQCIGREGPNADAVIEGCTAVIRAGQDLPRNLATAFDNRGGGAADIAAAKSINPNIAEQFDHSESSVR